MSVPDENKRIVRRLLEAMDRGDLSILDVICDGDLVVHFMDAELTREQVKSAAAGFTEAFPDLKHTILTLVAEDDRVTLRATDVATHRGAYKGIPATGRRVEFSTVATYRITNGKIAEVWQQMDVNALMKQLKGD